MGCRGQVKMQETGVYLYTHWRGDELMNIVKKAIARKQWWDDVEYLTRIIFCEMISPIKTPMDVGTAKVVECLLTEETGFGIGNELHADLNVPLIIVDTENKIVVECGEAIPFGKC